MSKLKKDKFSELYSMASGISSKPEQAGHGTPFLTFSNVFNNFFVPDTLTNLMDTSEREQEVYSIKKGDIFLTRTSETINELAMSCVALNDYPQATYSGFVKRLRPLQDNITYEKYMGFYLRSKFFRKTMTNNAVLTLRASLNEEIYSYLNLYLPEFENQKKIGDFLLLINDKITLNNRINTELEAMAKTLYDYWFVQFDFPNNEGKPYKSSGGKMVWSEDLKREIPVGWEVKDLSNVIEIKYGKDHKKLDFGSIPVYGSGGIMRYADKALYDKESILIPRKGTLSNLFYLNKPFWSVDTMFFSKMKIENIGKYLFYYLHSLNLASLNAGTAVPSLTTEILNQLKIAVPSSNILKGFDDILTPAFEMKEQNIKENQQLATLRDWLLPILMNGQVVVE